MSASSSDLEKSLISLSAQISQLEQQRKTLVFSSPEEEAEADRALEDLKRRHAATLSSYLESQASRSSDNPSPSAKPSKKGGSFFTVLIIAFAILCSLSLMFIPYALNKNPKDSSRASVSQAYLVNQSISSFEKSFPDHAYGTFDEKAGILSLYFWIDGSADFVPYAQAGRKDAVQSWNSLLDTLKQASSVTKSNFTKAGFDVMVSVYLLNPDNHSKTLAQARDGKLVYDVVSAG